MRDDDFNWLAAHDSEIVMEYAGKWIAVRNGAVIGVGETVTEAASAAGEETDGGDFILEAIDADVNVIYQ